MSNMTNELATALRAATAWERALLTEESRGRDSSMALPEVPWLASAEKVLEAFDAQQTVTPYAPTPDGTLPSEEIALHVIFGESPEKGTTPQTFIFETIGERQTFINGMSAAQGHGDYDIVEDADFAVYSDGEIRLCPPEVDPELPAINYVMHTADGCESTTVYGLTPAYQLVTLQPGVWTPNEPDAETTSVEIEVCFEDGSEYVELDGDLHRDLESNDRLDAYIVALAKDDAHAADEILREVSEDQGAQP